MNFQKLIDYVFGGVFMSKRLLALTTLAMFSLSVLLFGCGQSKQTAKASTETVIKVGSETTFAPFEFQDEQTKEYVGFDIDLMQAIGTKMGVKVEIASMGFDGLIPALNAGNIDAAISGMTITEERKQKVAFSDPYYQSGLSMVVKLDNDSIHSFKDLEGKRIAVQIGTTGAEAAKKVSNATVREYNNAPEAFMELKAGGVDVVINDKPVNDYYLAQDVAKEAKAVTETLTSEDYGIAFDKNNTELVAKVNKALAELKANGEYDKIYQKWFAQK